MNEQLLLFKESNILINNKEKFFISFLDRAYDTGYSETALIFGDESDPTYWTLDADWILKYQKAFPCGLTYWILDGDWRLEYEKAFPYGLKECKKIYLENIEFKSGFSDEL